jgi:lysophospholipase L1-like esterase
MKQRLNLTSNQTIVFIGDSITDAGRLEKAYRPLGYGYVHFVANWLIANNPEYNLNIVNTGISGNSIRDLKCRWERDCLNHKPHILSVLIGINDVCRQYNTSSNEAVLHDEYEVTYKQLLSQLKENFNCQLVLMEPFLICDNKKNPIYNTLKDYIDTVGDLANEFDAVLVPLQKMINKKIKNISPQIWSDDMVHPFLWAHAWIAQQWLKVTKQSV